MVRLGLRVRGGQPRLLDARQRLEQGSSCSSYSTLASNPLAFQISHLTGAQLYGRTQVWNSSHPQNKTWGTPCGVGIDGALRRGPHCRSLPHPIMFCVKNPYRDKKRHCRLTARLSARRAGLRAGHILVGWNRLQPAKQPFYIIRNCLSNVR